jgi:hypothetical protein
VPINWASTEYGTYGIVSGDQEKHSHWDADFPLNPQSFGTNNTKWDQGMHAVARKHLFYTVNFLTVRKINTLLFSFYDRDNRTTIFDQIESSTDGLTWTVFPEIPVGFRVQRTFHVQFPLRFIKLIRMRGHSTTCDLLVLTRFQAFEFQELPN